MVENWKWASLSNCVWNRDFLLLFVGNKWHNQVIVGNLSVSTFAQAEFYTGTCVLRPKFSEGTLVIVPVVSNVSLLMFLDSRAHCWLHVHYFPSFGPYFVPLVRFHLIQFLQNVQLDDLLLLQSAESERWNIADMLAELKLLAFDKKNQWRSLLRCVLFHYKFAKPYL